MSGSLSVAVAIGCAGVTAGDDQSLSLCAGLIEKCIKGTDLVGLKIGFAVTVTDTDNGRDVLLNGVLQGIKSAVLGIHEHDAGARGDGPSPLNVEVGFIHVSGDHAGIARTGD